MKLKPGKGLKAFRTGDELLLYNKATCEIHRLDARAAFVYDQCDGGALSSEIVSAAKEEWGDPDSEAIVEGTLELLMDRNLLVGTDTDGVVSRRRVLSKAAAVVAASVTTMVAPTPAQAQSGGGGGE